MQKSANGVEPSAAVRARTVVRGLALGVRCNTNRDLQVDLRLI
eukprot:COSAG06_NODE_49071_length_328_cov_0.371179_1_plen_42_part_01